LARVGENRFVKTGEYLRLFGFHHLAMIVMNMASNIKNNVEPVTLPTIETAYWSSRRRSDLYSIGYTPLESGGVVSVATLSYLLAQPLAGHLADKIDIAKTVFGGLLLAVLAIITVTLPCAFLSSSW